MSLDMNSEELAAAIIADLESANLRHYVNAIEPNLSARSEAVIWPHGKPVTSVEDARAFVGNIAYEIESV